MSEAKLNSAYEADLKHLIKYINDISTVTEITVEAGADVSLYNYLCSKLNPRARQKAILSYVA